MAHSITHNKVTAVVDDPAFDVGSSEWNDNHNISIDASAISHGGLANLTVGNPHTQYLQVSIVSGMGNPTTSIGLTAANGSAITAMRSDGAPALSQAIAPTWTGSHTFTRSAGTDIAIKVTVGETRLVGNTIIGRDATPIAPLQVSTSTSMTVDQYITVGPTLSGGGFNVGYGGGSYGTGISFLNAHAAVAANATMLFATQGTFQLGLYNSDGGVRVTTYLSNINALSAPTNVTAGDASFKRVMVGTDVAFGGVNTAPAIQINSAQSSAVPNGGALVLTTPTAATNGTPQASPSVQWIGRGWNTTNSTSALTYFTMYVVPVQSAGLTGSYLALATADANTGVFPYIPFKFIHPGIFDSLVGFRINGAAADGAIMIGNGTNYVASTTTWVTFTPTLAASTGTWSGGSNFSARYVLIGKTMTVSFAQFGMTTSNATQFLYLTIPASKTAVSYVYTTCNAADTSVALTSPAMQTVAGDTRIYFRHDWLLGNWAAGTGTIDVAGEITFEVA